MNTMSETEHVSTCFQGVGEMSHLSQPEDSITAKNDLQQKLDLLVARFSAALLQEGLDEKVLIRGLQFELV